ncbi:MAG: 50S ribosomal protein L11 methyltransferase [Candidatus Amulumruptor caecigallinarius]|nr:MAG: 50S ribosomal protein L11 methyltransferase [Candidatus Amulumruptor caecigallinarius]
MNDYRQTDFRLVPCSADMTDLLAAFLADAGYESFVTTDAGMTAYVREEDFDAETVDRIIAEFPFDTHIVWTSETVEGRDWNSEWEKNYFRPIVVGDKVAIHSSFHTDVPDAAYDIVIDPKMAFGTGHHATTSLMIRFLLDCGVEGKAVTDMGTGSGILAILASMLGASHVAAIEIDEMAVVNARENVEANGAGDAVEVVLGDAASLEKCQKADLFLANINRNIIINDMALYAGAIKEGGIAVFSGFYLADVPLIEKAAVCHGLVLTGTSTEGDWCRAVFRKQ